MAAPPPVDMRQVIEDNVLTWLDSTGVKNQDDIEDDKISFLEAVHALCISGRQPRPPTVSVHETVFRILEANDSMELNTASYALLIEMAEQYPHITVGQESFDGRSKEIIIDNKIWTPFHEESDVEGRCGTRCQSSAKTCLEKFLILLREIQLEIEQNPLIFNKIEEHAKNNNKVIGKLLKFKYLFQILYQDFKCRLQAYRSLEKDEIMHGCYVVQLFKEGTKDLIMLILDLIVTTYGHRKCGAYVIELEQFSTSVQDLLEMRLSLELEITKMKDARNKRGRKDVPRQPIFELVRDILCNYDKFSILMQAMRDTEHKLRIILQVFCSFIPKALINEKIKDQRNVTVQEMFSCLEDVSSARAVFNVFTSERLKVLIISASKVSLQHTSTNALNKAPLELSHLMKTALANLQTISKSEFCELDPDVAQALVTAEAWALLAK